LGTSKGSRTSRLRPTGAPSFKGPALLAKIGQEIADTKSEETPERFRFVQAWRHWLGRVYDWTAEDLGSGISTARDLASKAAGQASRAASRSFASWIQGETLKGMKGIHQLTREVPDGANHAGQYEFFFYSTPDKFVAQRAGAWYDRWNRDSHQVVNQKWKEALENLARVSNQEDPLPILAPRTIRNKLGTIKSNRALSLDHHSCGDLKELPLEAYEDLATTFNQISKEGEWPMNGTLVPVAFIPKDDGGDRPIGITPSWRPSSLSPTASSSPSGRKST